MQAVSTDGYSVPAKKVENAGGEYWQGSTDAPERTYPYFLRYFHPITGSENASRQEMIQNTDAGVKL